MRLKSEYSRDPVSFSIYLRNDMKDGSVMISWRIYEAAVETTRKEKGDWTNRLCAGVISVLQTKFGGLYF